MKGIFKSFVVSLFSGVLFAVLWAVVTNFMPMHGEKMNFTDILWAGLVIYAPVYFIGSFISYLLVYPYFKLLSFEQSYIHGSVFAVLFALFVTLLMLLKLEFPSLVFLVAITFLVAGISYTTVKYAKFNITKGST